MALLQVLSYPFHDPVLTDRGFITEEKVMLKSYIVAGIAGFAAIFLFSFVGIHARIEGLTGGDNVPAAVARSFGLGALFVMTIIMVNAAGSTLDSAFSSVSKAVALDVPMLAGRIPGLRAVGTGRYALLLGTNAYGLLICTAGFLLPLAWQRAPTPGLAR